MSFKRELTRNRWQEDAGGALQILVLHSLYLSVAPIDGGLQWCALVRGAADDPLWTEEKQFTYFATEEEAKQHCEETAKRLLCDDLVSLGLPESNGGFDSGRLRHVEEEILKKLSDDPEYDEIHEKAELIEDILGYLCLRKARSTFIDEAEDYLERDTCLACSSTGTCGSCDGIASGCEECEDTGVCGECDSTPIGFGGPFSG